MEKEWRIKRFEDEHVRSLSQDVGLRIPTIKALLNCGIQEAQSIRSFLQPSFQSWSNLESFPDLKAGAEILYQKIQEGKKICIHGDFDADGVSATIILKECFNALKIPCETYVPNREEGHGLSLKSLETVKKLGIDLIITVDSGITAHEEVEKAKSYGIDVIITDHHLPGENLPNALAIINPQCPGGEGFKEISGSGVSFKLALELASKFPRSILKAPAFESFILHGTILAALATIGDVVPLKGANRSLVAQALTLFEHVEWPSIKSLMKKSNLKAGRTTAEDLAFQILPKLNAAQRMERGELVLELFQCSDEKKATQTCNELHRLNEERKSHQKAVTNELIHKYTQEFQTEGLPDGIVISGDYWREGISGLIASRFSETYHRPTAVVLFKNGLGQASCRAPEGFRLKKILEKLSHHLVVHGGHDQAAGFRILETEFEHFRTAFQQECQEQLKVLVEKGRGHRPKLQILHELHWNELSLPLLMEIEKLEPFGHENPKPLFASRNIWIDGQPNYFGREGDHVMMSLSRPGLKSIKAKGFFLGEKVKRLQGTRQIDIAYHLSRDPYRGTFELQLKDLRPHQNQAS